jgi:hypothetical protein
LADATERGQQIVASLLSLKEQLARLVRAEIAPGDLDLEERFESLIFSVVVEREEQYAERRVRDKSGTGTCRGGW